MTIFNVLSPPGSVLFIDEAMLWASMLLKLIARNGESHRDGSLLLFLLGIGICRLAKF